MNSAAPTPVEPTLPCPNCGAPLQGDYCHSCGQPKKGMIRPLSGIMADVVDSVLNIDSRILRTVGPLLFRPGRLTNDYFAGRRTRYVTPFRLFFFMTVVAFFTVQWYLDQSSPEGWKLNVDDSAIDRAQTQSELQKQLDEQMAELDKARAEMAEQIKAGGPGRAGLEAGLAGLEAGREELRKRARIRADWILRADEAKAKNLPLPPFISEAIDKGEEDLSFNGKPWDAKDNPIKFDWLPDAGNAKLNQMASNARDNLRRGIRDPKRLAAGVLNVLPQTLFVMMPLFAVLLKIFYIFKRRLYMEHLIVALHSHAFISFSLLIVSALGLVKTWVPSIAVPAGWIMSCLGVWVPVYLFLMQKRVYRQGWIMTTLKFGAIGICYTMLISTAVAIAAVASLAIAS
jgi:hypothetical protein